MLFGTRGRCENFENMTINVGQEQLQPCDKVKYLGVILDPQLKFDKHVQYVKSKTVGKIKLLGRIAPIIKQKIAL